MTYDFLYTILYVVLAVFAVAVGFVFYVYRRVLKNQPKALKVQDEMVERQKKMLEVQEQMLGCLKNIEQALKK